MLFTPAKTTPRKMRVLSVKHIRTFSDFEAASAYIDARLNDKPAFNFNIQQTANG